MTKKEITYLLVIGFVVFASVVGNWGNFQGMMRGAAINGVVWFLILKLVFWLLSKLRRR